ncbi:hypothetical protein [Dictyobacter kobayashii]|uniref:Nucleotidyltransferase family protein n=1 Tax=Dictyobacter kobayashii TaxID=2014872 RepID=A0A402AUR2_9CHLR|nr:hypothetical protein [Dictyobacter kobayashii]GCE22763.1 hypothetical protein KDK_65630 [Dictyobacter kobayashii]
MYRAQNTIEFVRTVMRQLEVSDIHTYLFGGWAEELWQLSAPRSHADIDLLYPAADFQLVDKWLQETAGVVVRSEKHFHHKRALLYNQVKLELFLLEPLSKGYVTNYFGDLYRLYWKPDSLVHLELPDGDIMPLASTTALQAYQQHHHLIQDAYQRYIGRQVHP